MGGEGALINFLPLKGGGAYFSWGGDLIEDLQYFFFNSWYL